MTAVAILLAGGSGRRLHLDTPKAFVEVGGRTLLEHAIRGCDLPSPNLGAPVVLVAPSGYEAHARRIAEASLEGASLRLAAVVSGGETRGESVRRALEGLPEGASEILCHDVARPFASASLWHRVHAGLAEAEGVVPVLPAVDTIKRVRDGFVTDTLTRQELAHVQTPQGFRRDVLERAHREAAGVDASDDAALVERLGYRVMTVSGERFNIKVTVQDDLVIANAIAARRAVHDDGLGDD